MKFYFISIICILFFTINYISCECNVNGKCPKLGEDCSSTLSCSPGLFCNTKNMVCDSLESCVPQVSLLNDTCSQSGYICSKTSLTNQTTGVCLPYINQKLIGSPCKSEVNCNNQVCSNNVCTLTGPTIGCVSDSDCLYNFFCYSIPITSATPIAIGLPGIGNVCTLKYSPGSACQSSNQCQLGYSCINGNCSSILTGKENDSCIIPSTYSPLYNPCSPGLVCQNGKCIKYVENSPCNTNSNTCQSYETCQCSGNTNGDGVCKLRYKYDDDCKNALNSVIGCSTVFQVPAETNYYKLNQLCSIQLCNYSNYCINKDYDSCYKESYALCPSGNYTSNEDSSDSSNSSLSSSSHSSSESSSSSSLSSSSSNSTSSNGSSSSNSTSSNSASSSSNSSSESDDVNSSNSLLVCYFYISLVLSILFLN